MTGDCLTTVQLARFQAGSASPPERAAVEAHLAACALCRASLSARRTEAIPRVADSLPETTYQPARPPEAPEAADGIDHAIPGYRIAREIYRGGQGIVYQAEQEATGRAVAVKVLLQGPFAAPRQRRRFEREIELVAGLRHRNIVAVYESGTTPHGLLYYAMEYIDGVSLTDHVRRAPAPSLPAVLRLFRTICAAVHYAHQRGVIHRDLKPGNILIDAAGESHVLDFGLARSLAAGPDPAGPPMTQTGDFLGTPAYASPEQARGDLDQIDVRSDVYSLGVILYELLTGRFPYDVSGRLVDVLQAVIRDEPVAPRSWSRQPSADGPPGYRLDARLEAVLLKALAKHPEQRYQSAGELADDLSRYLAGEAPRAAPPNLAFRMHAWLRRHFQATLWTVTVGLVCGTLAPLPRLIYYHTDLWRECQELFAVFPDLHRPWQVDVALALPPWAWQLASVLMYSGSAAVGLLVALLARPRNRDEALVAGMAAGLVGGLAAFGPGGMGSFVFADVLRAGLGENLDAVLDATRHAPEPSGAARAAALAEALAQRYPELTSVPAAERIGYVRARTVAFGLTHLHQIVVPALVFALAYYCASGVSGTLMASHLLRQRGRAWRAVLPYAEMAIPASALLRAILVWPAGVISAMDLAVMATLTAVAVVGNLRRWPWVLRLALYTAGAAAWLHVTGVRLPGYLLLAAAAVAALAAVLPLPGPALAVVPATSESGYPSRKE